MPFLSIIIPAYNEERRLPPTLEKIVAYLRAQPYGSEIIVIENGSTDRTTQAVEQFIAQLPPTFDNPRLALLHSRPGKGAAVHAGMLAARGDFRFICDADLAMPIAEIAKFLPPELPSRQLRHRHRQSRGAGRRALRRAILSPPHGARLQRPRPDDGRARHSGHPVRLQDVHRVAAELVFPLQRIDGWSFDVEVLYIGERHGLRLVEVPIDWYYQSDSRVRPVQDTLNMVRELLRIRRNGRAGIYNTPVRATRDELPAV